MVPGDYLIVAGVAFAATVVAVPVVKWLARTVGAVSYPEARHVHTVPTPVLGGLAMFVGVLIAFFTGSRLPSFAEVFGQTSDPEAVLLAASVVVLLGIVDDVRGMAAPVKLAGQLLGGALLVMFGMSLLFIYVPGDPGSLISLTPDLSTLLTVAGIVIMINAVNLADGLDGLAAGMVGIGALALLVYVETADNTGTIVLDTPSVAPLVLCAIVGVCAGFLVFNFHPASVFMGDTGSMLLGLLLAAAGIAALEVVIAPTDTDIAAISAPILVPALVLAVPLFDTVWAMGRRYRRLGSVFAPDKRHLHHRLVEIGHSQRRAVSTMYYWSAVFAFAGVGTSVLAPVTVGLVLAGAASLAVLFTLVERVSGRHRARRMSWGRGRATPDRQDMAAPEPGDVDSLDNTKRVGQTPRT
jgi:UDP-GlcNAc:undecaprenyl-phosphate GlcNAc-1-phosphate transferase